MLSICISDKGMLLVDAAIKGKKKIVVKNFTRAVGDGAFYMNENGFADYDRVREYLVAALNDLGNKDKKAYVTIDSASIVYEEIRVPFQTDRKVKVDLKQYMARFGAKANAYVADYKLNGKEKIEGRVMCNVSVIFVYAKVISEISRLMNSVGITPLAVDIAQNASLKIINKCIEDTTCKFDKEFILLDYKQDFVTLYLYKDGVKCHTENFEMKQKNGTRSYFLELKTKIDVINDIANERMITPTNIYVTGEVMQIKWALQKLANVEDMNVNQLPMPKKVIRNIKNIEFNEYYAPLGTLLRSIN
ncbi:MAG: hypothetical protein HFK07_06000 [Clostridia bacterium]|jgi:Tfp pilus assembly PilM family ATPase|nr:hypothetical protein [Clostridia bacterium]MCX4366913.1 hypothetical protein [Clostridia bacterium]